MTKPVLEGSNLSYHVKILEGEIPASFGTASLFVDHHGGAGGYILSALGGAAGGALLGSSLTKANDNAKEARREAEAPRYYEPEAYPAPGYAYRAAPPAPCP